MESDKQLVLMREVWKTVARIKYSHSSHTEQVSSSTSNSRRQPQHRICLDLQVLLRQPKKQLSDPESFSSYGNWVGQVQTGQTLINAALLVLLIFAASTFLFSIRYLLFITAVMGVGHTTTQMAEGVDGLDTTMGPHAHIP